MLETILDRRNLEKALRQVVANGGSAGIDGMQTDEFRDYLSNSYQELRQSVLSGTYEPLPVKSVIIPKSKGGTRQLGIPSVKDRLLQQAISQWLSQFYEPTFSPSSYGFRRGRSAHQAVLQAQRYLQEGKTWIVELDLSNFFDRVNHDRLISVLKRQITDRRTLRLIRQYLNSGILQDGIVSQRTEGTPQGSPLSPLLSNIVLDELDKELERRGLSFVRYADDISLYVRSEKSAQRVLKSISRYIEDRLLLKVNETKSQVSRPWASYLLGFSFYRQNDGYKIRISPESIRRVKQKCKEVTGRSNGLNTKQKVAKLSALITGWISYFKLATASKVMTIVDQYVRTRLRIGIWKEWKHPRRRVANLRKLGASKVNAIKWGNSSKGYCRIANSRALQIIVDNAYFTKLGYTGFRLTYERQAKMQKSLF
jgi:RNA-directed DNA polymerase